MSNVSAGYLSAMFELRGISQYYGQEAARVSVLENIDLTLYHGETCAIVGASGSGKSTLLNILGMLERPASGRLTFAGNDVMTATPDTLANWRNYQLGFIFQAFNLLPRLSALDNVALPLLYRNQGRQAAREIARKQLHAVGLADRADHRPADLSGGQRQRVAIARALVGQPSVILADEPTGNLDQRCTDDIIELLLKLNRQQDVTLVVVTHDSSLSTRFSRQIEVVNGGLRERAEHDAA